MAGKYNQETVDAFFEAYMTIDDETRLRPSVEVAARKADISKTTFFNWVAKYPEVQERYLKAMKATAIFMIEEVIEIADDTSKDTIKDSWGNNVMDKEWVQRSKIRMEARQWALSHLMPKVFRDRVGIDMDVKLAAAIQIAAPDQYFPGAGGQKGIDVAQEDATGDIVRDVRFLRADQVRELLQAGKDVSDAEIVEEDDDNE